MRAFPENQDSWTTDDWNIFLYGAGKQFSRLSSHSLHTGIPDSESNANPELRSLLHRATTVLQIASPAPKYYTYRDAVDRMRHGLMQVSRPRNYESELHNLHLLLTGLAR